MAHQESTEKLLSSLDVHDRETDEDVLAGRTSNEVDEQAGFRQTRRDLAEKIGGGKKELSTIDERRADMKGEEEARKKEMEGAEASVRGATAYHEQLLADREEIQRIIKTYGDIVADYETYLQESNENVFWRMADTARAWNERRKARRRGEQMTGDEARRNVLMHDWQEELVRERMAAGEAETVARRVVFKQAEVINNNILADAESSLWEVEEKLRVSAGDLRKLGAEVQNLREQHDTYHREVERLEGTVQGLKGGIAGEISKTEEELEAVEQKEAEYWARLREEFAGVAGEVAGIEKKHPETGERSLQEQPEREETPVETVQARELPSWRISPVETAVDLRVGADGEERAFQDILRDASASLGVELNLRRQFAELAEHGDVGSADILDELNTALPERVQVLVDARRADLWRKYEVLNDDELKAELAGVQAKVEEGFRYRERVNGMLPLEPRILKSMRTRIENTQLKLVEENAKKREQAERALRKWIETELKARVAEMARDGVIASGMVAEVFQTLDLPDRRYFTMERYVQALREATVAFENIERWRTFSENRAELIDQMADIVVEYLEQAQQRESYVTHIEQENALVQAAIDSLRTQREKIENRKRMKDATRERKLKILDGQIEQATEELEANERVSKRFAKEAAELRKHGQAELERQLNEILPVEFSGERLFDRPRSEIGEIYTALMHGVQGAEVVRGTGENRHVIQLDDLSERLVDREGFVDQIREASEQKRQEMQEAREQQAEALRAQELNRQIIEAGEEHIGRIDGALMDADDAQFGALNEEALDRLRSTPVAAGLANTFAITVGKLEAYEEMAADGDERANARLQATLGELRHRVEVFARIYAGSGDDQLESIVTSARDDVIELESRYAPVA